MKSAIEVSITDVVYDQYSKMVERLCSPDEVIRSAMKTNPDYARLLHAAMGICTEGGELLDQMKKCIIYGREFDKVNAVEELGDTLWYITLACNALKITLAEVMLVNTKKLEKRYPHQFDKDRELSRDIAGERAILEAVTNQDWQA